MIRSGVVFDGGIFNAFSVGSGYSSKSQGVTLG